MPNYKLTLCYDGTRYRGWQKQGNTDNTIQALLETRLSALIGRETELAGSGRTDAGVHAAAQVCSFRTDAALDCADALARLRDALPEDIGALALEEAPPRFHARLSCVGKRYLYRVWNSAEPCVFERRFVFPFPEPLDEAAMRRAAAQLTGTHDFTSFCGNPHMKKSAVRTLRAVDLAREGRELRLTFEGDGFLMHMVRILTGTLLEVGTHRREADSMPALLDARSRAAAGFTAPARGLTLLGAEYDGPR